MFSNPHESLELFVKTTTPKLTYICRTTPLSLTPFQDFIKQTTTTNINYLLNLLQVPHLHPNKELHLSRVEAAGLPKSKGGGGLSYSQNTHQAAFLGSWISVYRSCSEFKPELTNLFEDFWKSDSPQRQALHQAYDHFESFISSEWKLPSGTSVHELLTQLTEPPSDSMGTGENYKPQKKFTSCELRDVKKKIMDPTQDKNLCRAIRENEVGPTTHLWMTAYPDKDTSGPKPYRAWNAEDFRSAYRRRLDSVDPHLGALCELGTVKCGFCEKRTLCCILPPPLRLHQSWKRNHKKTPCSLWWTQEHCQLGRKNNNPRRSLPANREVTQATWSYNPWVARRPGSVYWCSSCVNPHNPPLSLCHPNTHQNLLWPHTRHPLTCTPCQDHKTQRICGQTSDWNRL